MSLDQKRQAIETITNFLSAKDEIDFAFLYGSFNDYDDNLAFHDIDIGVYVHEIEERRATYYALELSDQLSLLLHVTVDVRVLNFAPVPFLYHVINGELILEKDEDRRCDFVEYVLRHYLDMKPLWLRSIKEAFSDGA